MTVPFQQIVILVAACLPLAIAGCGPRIPDGLMAVKGSVTFQSRPVPYGEVVIEPDRAKANHGPQSRCQINAGSYATRAGFGAPVGPVVVTVTGLTRPPFYDYLESKPLFEPHTFTAVLDAAAPQLDITVPAP